MTVVFTNRADVETTVHWHGLGLDIRYDGVPEAHRGGMQPTVPPGESFSYRLCFPDPGIYWYYPHLREHPAPKVFGDRSRPLWGLTLLGPFSGRARRLPLGARPLGE